jgi:hypothetical protein
MKDDILKKKLSEFSILIGLGFPIIIGWILPVISGHSFRIWTLWVGIAFLIMGRVKPYSLIYPYIGWMTIGRFLGLINSYIFLGLVFIIVVQPIALIMKFVGYDPLKTKKRNEMSYRENKSNHKVNLSKPF